MQRQRTTSESEQAVKSQSVPTATLLAIAQNLPQEMISEVFSYCTPQTLHISLPSRRLGRPNICASRVKVKSTCPWNLAHVCLSWRRAALATPNFWNDVSIVLTSNQEAEWALAREFVDSCLARTGRSLISLEILIKPFYKKSMDPISQPILDFILPYTNRLKHIYLQPAAVAKLFAKLSPGRVQSLESVKLSLPSIDLSLARSTPASMTVFHGASSLRKVKFTTQDSFYSCKFDFPWAQLTELEFEHSSYQCHAMLRQCTNLTRLKLPLPIGSLPAFTLPIHLPRLEALMVYSTTSAHFGRFLGPFVFPSMKLLQIHLKSSTDVLSGSICSLMSRSSYPVEHLDIKGMSAFDIFCILIEIPSLTELSLRDTGNYTLDRKKLIIFIVDQLPQLQRITCDIPIANGLIELLEGKANVARHRMYTSIQSISIDCTMEGTLTPSTRSAMSVVQARGMEIILLE